MGSIPQKRKTTSNFEAIWLAIGVVLSASTQTRLKHAFGPGEVMLVLWIIKELYLNIREPIIKYSVSHPLGKFWLASLSFMIIGWAYAIYIGRESSESYRDFISYLFAAIFSITLCSSNALLDYKKIMYWIFVFATILYGSLLIYLFHSIHIGPFMLVYQDARFQGLTDNPNQVALISSALPIFMVLNWTSLKPLGKLINIFLFLVAVAVGIACSSDAWKLSWLVMIGLLLLSPLFTLIKLWAGGKVSERLALRTIVLTSLLIFIVGFTFSHSPAKLQGVADKVFHHGTSAGDRLTLWQNGVFALREDPIFGLGPGPHSGFGGPFEGEESHSSFVEWATIAGIFCCLYLAVLFIVPIKKALENKEFATAIGLSALGIILIFHFLLRHPLVWMYLILLTAAAGRFDHRKKTAPTLFSAN